MRIGNIILAVAALGGIYFSIAPASAKTVKECNAEYEANKPAIQGAKQLKKDFVSACRAGTETIPGGTAATTPAAAPAPQPAPAPIPTAAPAPTTPAPIPAGQARGPAAAKTAPTITLTPAAAASEVQTQATCPTTLVVWVNTSSKIYHFKGYRDYGATKAGTFMCEPNAVSAGDRAAKNEKHP